MRDLIDEAGKDFCTRKKHNNLTNKYSIEVVRFEIKDKKDEKEFGFEKGDYVIVNSPLTHLLFEDVEQVVCDTLRCEILRMFKKQNVCKKQKFLLVGLGNPAILADSLGIKVLEKIEIDFINDKNNILKITPNVFVATGINSFDIVHYLVACFGIDCVIIVDSLATANTDRLGVSFQVNSAGLTPGSALNSFGKKLSRNTLGVCCFAIGVPFMIIGEKVLKSEKDIILTAKDVHKEIDNTSQIISKMLNSILK